MVYSICYKCTDSSHVRLYGLAFVSSDSCLTNFGLYRGKVPTRHEIIDGPSMSHCFKSLNELTNYFLSLYPTINFYDYEEL